MHLLNSSVFCVILQRRFVKLSQPTLPNNPEDGGIQPASKFKIQSRASVLWKRSATGCTCQSGMYCNVCMNRKYNRNCIPPPKILGAFVSFVWELSPSQLLYFYFKLSLLNLPHTEYYKYCKDKWHTCRGFFLWKRAVTFIQGLKN